jgi:molybdopterin-guanine dinucleotide biosynthesis protein A
VHDGVAGAGPLAGILACLEACRTEWLILLPVDMPGVTPKLLDALANNREARGACFRRGGKRFPLPLVLPVSSLPAVRACLAEGRRSVHSLLDHLDIRSIDIDLFPDLGDPELLLVNINTPGDFANAMRFPGRK